MEYENTQDPKDVKIENTNLESNVNDIWDARYDKNIQY